MLRRDIGVALKHFFLNVYGPLNGIYCAFELQKKAVAGGVFALAGASDWVDRGIANLRGGCPTTAGIVYEQLRRAPELSLADSYRLELTVATHCANNEDFHEGVRALLIDKDGAKLLLVAFSNVFFRL